MLIVADDAIPRETHPQPPLAAISATKSMAIADEWLATVAIDCSGLQCRCAEHGMIELGKEDRLVVQPCPSETLKVRVRQEPDLFRQLGRHFINHVAHVQLGQWIGNPVIVCLSPQRPISLGLDIV